MLDTPSNSFEGSGDPLTPRMSLIPHRPGVAAAAVPAGPSVLGADDAAPRLTVPLTAFAPAQPPVLLTVPAPDAAGPGVLGPGGGPEEEEAARVATLEFQPDPQEGAVYALVHEIHTPDGIVYDVTLPEISGSPAVLGPGGAGPAALRFPVHRLVSAGSGSASESGPAVLGLRDTLVEQAVNLTVKHVLHLVKAPVEQYLIERIAAAETQPQVLPVGLDGRLGGALLGYEAWRSLFAPGREHRVLLYIHGFISNADNSLPRAWLSAFGSAYDAVLAYDHPTISRDPFTNAADLLAQIPDDIRLNVDLVAHSRGGLVSRSLIELQELAPKLNVARLLTCGAPHAGTLLADRGRWDRLVSIGMSGASWLAAATGAGGAVAFIPKLLEFVLRAASQMIFDLPGIAAMVPGGPFLARLNAAGEATLAERARYAAVVSDFDLARVTQLGFREGLRSLALQAFMRVSNDLIVPTESMSSIDLPRALQLGGRVFQTEVDHFSYFRAPDAQSFAEQFLVV